MRCKAMTFNILVGGEDRFEQIVDIIRAAQPDLLVLQECVDWDKNDRLTQVGDALGITGANHLFLARARTRPSGKCYHLGVVSRAPLEDVRVHDDPAIVHALVEGHITVGDLRLRFFGAHYHSRTEDTRLAEARYLDAYVARENLLASPCVLLGDLNALTRRDPYDATLADQLRAAGMKKYDDPPRFDVMDVFSARGWVDALAERHARPWATAPRDKNGVHLELRTDYILTSPSLAAHLSSVEMIPVGAASDHHAVTATFD